MVLVACTLAHDAIRARLAIDHTRDTDNSVIVE